MALSRSGLIKYVLFCSVMLSCHVFCSVLSCAEVWNGVLFSSVMLFCPLFCLVMLRKVGMVLSCSGLVSCSVQGVRGIIFFCHGLFCCVECCVGEGLSCHILFCLLLFCLFGFVASCSALFKVFVE